MEPPVSRRPWWQRLRLSVRALMVLTLVIGGLIGWFIRCATIQREAVEAITAAGGSVRYDFQDDARPRLRNPSGTPSVPRWLVDLLGIDFFADVTTVSIQGPQGDAILGHIGRLHRLRWLTARSTPLTDAGLAHLAGLSELRGLSCSGSPALTDAGLARLSGLRRLEALDVEGISGIKGPGLSHLAGLDRLRYLVFYTETDAGLPSLSQLAGLRKLYIGMPDVSDEALDQLSRLTRLDELGFGGEAGSNAGLARLGSLTNLQVLQVWGPWLTDAGLARMPEMDRLRFFMVSASTSVTAGALNDLQRRMPSLRIGVNGPGRLRQAWDDFQKGAVVPESIPPGKAEKEGV
ncbi:hypothetical protein OJF2_75870 [Aquisphaera giovannonii]|uniref:Leucine Rich repeats (2 copies) n=1 Tax=Aquisphaera giovannonii TaxID=406548 RepID=A0A5B9WG30_9BACT|nr:hypothetical protein [Aquisphaera giovannonii]QEH38975.1 hypothetical protein OJF2_75870 [Aquisphaera giovannonii]